MKANYVPGKKLSQMEPGDWNFDEGSGFLSGFLPNGLFIRLPITGSGWVVTDPNPETITLIPSIDCKGSGKGWHGFLTNGEFISC